MVQGKILCKGPLSKRIAGIMGIMLVAAAMQGAIADTLKNKTTIKQTAASTALQQKILVASLPAAYPNIYFTDEQKSPGAVYSYNTVTHAKTAVYTRPSGNLESFLFAPWDSTQLYFVDANDKKIFLKHLTGGGESTIYTHKTYIRDIAFKDGLLYFSESSGGGGNGSIYQMSAGGTASLYYAVKLSDVNGYWAGYFTFDNTGALYLSSGNIAGANIYRVDVASSVVSKVFSNSSESIMGIAFDADGFLYFGNQKTTLYRLALPTMTKTVLYADPAVKMMSDAGFKPRGTTVTASVPTWVMPWSIGDVPFTTVSPTGTVNYTDGMSKFAMNDAPFGGYLGFRHGASSTIPNTAIKSYRWQYRRTGASVWTDFSEPVVVYYILEAPGALPALVPYKLGPNPIKGMNLYDFRPDASSLPKPISGSQTTWVSTGIMNTEFSGFWQSATKDLPADIYEIRLTVYSPTGVQVVPSAAFNFVLPILPAVNGVINTRLATASEMVDSGYRVKVNIDNRVCSGDIVPPKIGSTGADDCGMLRYAPTDTSKTQIGFSASQPGNHAVFKFSMIRGITSVPSTDVQSAEVSAAAAGVYVKNSTGYYNHGFTVTDLLGPCSSGGDAAFSENLNVYAKATTGNSYRIGAYDFSFVRAYALSKK